MRRPLYHWVHTVNRMAHSPLYALLTLLGLVTTSLADETLVCSRPESSEQRQTLLDELCPPSQTDQLRECGLRVTCVNESDSQQYVLSLSRATWWEARRRCHQCGYYLAKIESRAELAFIKRWLTLEGVYDTSDARMFNWYHIWVDGSDEGHEDCWVWTYPNVTRGSFFWGRHQPDNSHGAENSASLYRVQNMKGNDERGAREEPFLCERAVGETITDELPTMDEVRNTTVCPPAD